MIKQTECGKLKSNVKKCSTYIIGQTFSWRMCNWSLEVRFWGKKNFPGFKNLFLIYKDKIIWLYGLGEDKLRPSADINLQRSAYSRWGWDPSYNPATKRLGFNRIFLKRVLYKAVSSGAHQKTQTSLGIRNSLSSWRDHCSMSCFGKRLFVCV